MMTVHPPECVSGFTVTFEKVGGQTRVNLLAFYGNNFRAHYETRKLYSAFINRGIANYIRIPSKVMSSVCSFSSCQSASIFSIAAFWLFIGR